MTALPLRDFSAAERARLEAIEAAPAEPESVRERVARAMWETAHARFTSMAATWESTSEWIREHYRALADAALAVLSGPSSDAERAVERVLALAQDYQAAADEAAEAAQGQPPDVVEYYRRVTIAGYGAADRIRAAVAGPPC